MLTEKDIELVKATRESIEQFRREPITLHRKGTVVKDPITDEEIVTGTTPETVYAVWKNYTAEQLAKFAGFDVVEGEALVTFRLEIDLSNVEHIERNGIKYVIIRIDERGLGGINRREVTVKRVI